MWKIRLIGIIGLSSSVGLYVFYLLFIELIRQIVLEDSLGITACGPLWHGGWVMDKLSPADNLFEFSAITNMLLLITWSRWLILPWLFVYFINITVLTCLAIVVFIVPINSATITSATYDGFSTRYLGIPILLVDFLLMYLWLVVNAAFQDKKSFGSSDSDNTGGNDLEGKKGRKIRLVVQVSGGLLAFLSSVILVIINSTLMETVQKFVQKYRVEISNDTLKVAITAVCIITIITNLMVVFGASGSKWRRGFMVPWLILYGFMIIFLIGIHQWFTTLCWVEEKVYGMISLGTSAILLAIWTCVWLTAAEAAGESYQLLYTSKPIL